MKWKTAALTLFLAPVLAGLSLEPPEFIVLPQAGAVKSLFFGPEGAVLWTQGCADLHCVRKGVWGWDVESSRKLALPRPWTGEPPDVSERLEVSPQEFEGALFATVSPDRQLIAVGGVGSQLRILEAETRVPTHVFQPGEEALEAFRQTIGDELAQMGGGRWHSRLELAVTTAAFSPDGEVVVAAVTMTLGMGLVGSQLWFWDLDSKRPLCELILCRFSTGRAGFVEVSALGVHPREPLLAVALSTPGEEPQSRLGEVQLMELPACFPQNP